MNAIENNTDLIMPDDKNLASNNQQRSNNPGLRAMLFVRDFSVILQKDYEQFLQNEKELNELNEAALVIIDRNCTSPLQENWKTLVADVKKAIAALNESINEAKEKFERKEIADTSFMWNQVSLHLSTLKTKSWETVTEGFDILPENIHPQWEKDFEKLEKTILHSIISNVENCRVLLLMIARYSPDELNKITKIIVDQIPLEFTYEEAVTYQKDYYKSLVDFKQEFKEDKNLWDKFLDILAGGTHQPPSERVMLERWIEGKKGELD